MKDIDYKKIINEQYDYWKGYYMGNPIPTGQSNFAEFVIKYLSDTSKIIDLGCGNGRDSLFFANKGFKVVGVDLITEEIKLLNKIYRKENLNFISADFTKLGFNLDFNTLYSRFTLHSITKKQERDLFFWMKRVLKSGDLFCCEARSIHDPKLDQNHKISEIESFADNHYRRFIEGDKLKKNLEGIGLEIIYYNESDGLAKYNDEDPVVVRIVAQKI